MHTYSHTSYIYMYIYVNPSWVLNLIILRPHISDHLQSTHILLVSLPRSGVLPHAAVQPAGSVDVCCLGAHASASATAVALDADQ